MNVDSVLKLLRGSVRPLAVLSVIGGVIGFLATGQLEGAKFLAAFGGPILGWWFLERTARNKSGVD